MALRLSRSIVGEAEAAAVNKVIIEDGYLGMGKETCLFEQELAQYIGISPNEIITTNTGTAALHLAVEALATSLNKHDGTAEVIVPSLTFVASFQAITAANCIPVACDVLPETGTIDLNDIEKRITDKTIAIMHVHYASNPWQIDKVHKFAKDHNLRVIEDAAHAFGCKHHGKKIGSFGDIICFSFDGIKNITSGEGGAMVSFDPEVVRLASDARLLSVEKDAEKRFAGSRSWNPDVKYQGWRYHLSNIMAAIGRVQLTRLDNEFIPARQKLKNRYLDHLSSLSSLNLFIEDKEDFIVPHIIPICVKNGRKEELRHYLEENGIPTGIHYKPNHMLSFFKRDDSTLPITELLHSQLLTLPLHPGLNLDDIDTICKKIITKLNK